MTAKPSSQLEPPQHCPHCGQPLAAQQTAARDDGEPPPEYDHRGARMPRRSRVGGIITPQ